MCKPWRGIAGSYGNSVESFEELLAPAHTPTKRVRVSFSASSPTLICPFYLSQTSGCTLVSCASDLDFPADWWCSACIHALLATCTCPLEKGRFESFVLLLLSFILDLCSLHIDTSSLSYMYFADTVSYYMSFLIWWCSLKQRKFLN